MNVASPVETGGELVVDPPRRPRLRYFVLAFLALILAPMIVWGLGQYFRWWVPDLAVPEPFSHEGDSRQASLDKAMILIGVAKDKFAEINDYQCDYLQEELIEDQDPGKNQFLKNQIILKVRHEPFSVYMEWLAPKERARRRLSYPANNHPDKMWVADPKLTFGIRFSRPITDSLDRKQSRHTVKEAGLKYMIDRFHAGWKREIELGLTTVVVQDSDLCLVLEKAKVKQEINHSCQVVTTIHDPKDRTNPELLYFRSRVYFDKTTSLPVRVQNFGWPVTENDREGPLLEDYMFVNMKVNLGLKDRDFRW